MNNTTRVDQRATVRDLLDQIDADGHECDLTVDDLLDYMGILGVSFIISGDASLAYIEGLKGGGA